ncbi:MAG: hypothetical protein LBT29_02315 [Flavobacteriaceae bacterium]|jgi:hypothetical protein|nr:hypothetical protein [Flavobacteriaceae bacterium]
MKTLNTKNHLLLLLLFFAFSASFYCFFWSEYTYFDDGSESLVIGRLLESEKTGILSYGGFTGRLVPDDSPAFLESNNSINQYQLFLNDKKSFSDYRYITYNSQSGGQALLYSSIDKISPFSNEINLNIFRGINAILSAFVFLLFLSWCSRNYSFFNTFLTGLLLFLSPWIATFAHNLWWALWAFYLPFLCMLLLLERRHSGKAVSQNKIFLLLYASMFFKCIFNGMEYITTTLTAVFVPIVYYFVLEKKSFKDFFVFSLKAGMISILAVFSEILIIILQLKVLKGTFKAGLDHIIISYNKRTSDVVINDWTSSISNNEYIQLIIKYLAGDAFSWSEQKIRFCYIIFLVFLSSIVLLFLKNKKRETYKPLVFSTIFSVFTALSWILIFKQHSFIHTHLNFIVWYMPFLLFGFLSISVCISTLGEKILTIFKNKQ